MSDHQDATLLRLPTAPPAATPVSVQGALALELAPRLDPPPTTRPRGVPADIGGTVVDVDLRHRRSVEQWARRFAQAAVEIVGGDRPVTQLLRWTSGGVYADLERRAQLVARAGGHRPGVGRPQPVRPTVRSVHTCFVERSVVETSIHVRYGERSRALAARFEQRTGRHRDEPVRWVCTALDFA